MKNMLLLFHRVLFGLCGGGERCRRRMLNCSGAAQWWCKFACSCKTICHNRKEKTISMSISFNIIIA